MKSLFSLSSLLSVSLFLSLASFSLGSFSLPPGRLPAVDSVSALTPISIAGTQLLDGVTGNRFYSLGLGFDYAIDNLSVNNWKPAIDTLVADSPHINVLRTYIIDTKLEYNLFMDYTASKGIYVIVPLTAGDGCGNLPRGGTPPLGPDTCYPACLLSFGQAIIQQFSQFDNTLAFVVGNEVMNDDATWAAAPCVKAYARDLKSYTSTCGLRKIPLMYTAADNPITGYTAEQTDRLKADYLSCGTEENGIDVFGLNMFRWCGDTCTYQSCGYQQVNDALVGVGVPVLLTEYGCGAFVYGNGVFGIRSFKDTATLYNEMSDVFSGGAAYTYGVRGGYEFSFFNGGSQDPEGFTGLNKTCGYTINGDKCVVDLYEGQLATASPLIQNQAPASSSPSRLATCPATVLQYDMTLPPTRQGAPGFYFVQCPSGTGMVNTNNSPLPPDTWFGYSSSPTPDPTGAVPTPTITPTPTAAPTPTPTPSPTSTAPTATPTPSPTPSPTATPPTPPSSSGLAAAVGGTTGAGTGFDSETGSASGSDNSSIPPKTFNGGNTTIASNPIATGSNSKNGVVAVAPMLGIIVGLVAATVVLGM